MYNSCILFIYLFISICIPLALEHFLFHLTIEAKTWNTALKQSKSISEDKKSHWRKVLIKDFMSSEDSGKQMLKDGSECTVLYVKPLPWRSIQVTTGFHHLDEKLKEPDKLDWYPANPGEKSWRCFQPIKACLLHVSTSILGLWQMTASTCYNAGIYSLMCHLLVSSIYQSSIVALSVSFQNNTYTYRYTKCNLFTNGLVFHRAINFSYC